VQTHFAPGVIESLLDALGLTLDLREEEDEIARLRVHFVNELVEQRALCDCCSSASAPGPTRLFDH
jgi:hypothetical protein